MSNEAKTDSILQRHAKISKAPYKDMLSFFDFRHLPESLQNVSKPFYKLAQSLVDELPSHPQKMVALQKLLEAKDSAVRIAVAKTHAQRDHIKLLIAEGYGKGEKTDAIFRTIKEKYPSTNITEEIILEYIELLQGDSED
ncbi:MAG: hypothetical protein V7750_04070 [Sneathiella sp.]